VESSDLASALPHLAKCGYLGLNLTIPHKVDVLPLLKSVDEEARNIGAVNTLFYDCAKWNGFNSDGYGLEKALDQSLDISLNSAKVLILGAGGAARAAAAQALSRQCNQIWMANRSLSRLKILEKKLGETFDLSGFSTFELSKIPAELFKVEDLVIINATSLGLNKSDPQPISLSDFHSTTKVYDMIYNPARTGLLAEAVNLGMPCENGLSMLVHQAARSLSIWTKQDISSTTMFLSAKLALK
jgi:shikimate dehydrogenase